MNIHRKIMKITLKFKKIIRNEKQYIEITFVSPQTGLTQTTRYIPVQLAFLRYRFVNLLAHRVYGMLPREMIVERLQLPGRSRDTTGEEL